MPLTEQPAASLRGPAAAVARALDGMEPRVWMWRDGLTVIGLDSSLKDRHPDYLTFDDAAAGGAVEVREGPVQQVPVVEAATGPSAVLLLGGDTLIGRGLVQPVAISMKNRRREPSERPFLG